MSVDLDPYRDWLGVTVAQRPLSYYQLLGVEAFESDRELIQRAADAQAAKVQQHLAGAAARLAKRTVYELECAKQCLLDPDTKRRYDAKLRGESAGPATAGSPQSAQHKKEAAHGRAGSSTAHGGVKAGGYSLADLLDEAIPKEQSPEPPPQNLAALQLPVAPPRRTLTPNKKRMLIGLSVVGPAVVVSAVGWLLIALIDRPGASRAPEGQQVAANANSPAAPGQPQPPIAAGGFAKAAPAVADSGPIWSDGSGGQLAADLLLHYTFEPDSIRRDGDKVYVADRSGQGLEAVGERVKPVMSAGVGSGLLFPLDGSLRIPSALLRQRGEYTWAAWVNLATVEPAALYREWQDDGRAVYELTIDSWQALALQVRDTRRPGIPSNEGHTPLKALSANQWTFLAVRLATSGINNLVVTAQINEQNCNLMLPAMIHTTGDYATVGGFRGIVKELSIFDRALTDREIHDLYMLGAKWRGSTPANVAGGPTMAPPSTGNPPPAFSGSAFAAPAFGQPSPPASQSAPSKPVSPPDAALERRSQVAQAAIETLRTQPDNPLANQRLGEWYWCDKHQPEKGFPLLVKGANRDLRGAAGLELAAPSAAADQFALANAWWDLAQNWEEGAEKAEMLRRAALWYGRARPELPAASKTIADRHLKAIAFQLRPRDIDPVVVNLDNEITRIPIAAVELPPQAVVNLHILGLKNFPKSAQMTGGMSVSGEQRTLHLELRSSEPRIEIRLQMVKVGEGRELQLCPVIVDSNDSTVPFTNDRVNTLARNVPAKLDSTGARLASVNANGDALQHQMYLLSNQSTANVSEAAQKNYLLQQLQTQLKELTLQQASLLRAVGLLQRRAAMLPALVEMQRQIHGAAAISLSIDTMVDGEKIELLRAQ